MWQSTDLFVKKTTNKNCMHEENNSQLGKGLLPFGS
jgi:hypothetical protein